MQTVKIANRSDGVRIEEAVSQVAILVEGQVDWDVLTEPCRDSGYIPRAVLIFTSADGSDCTRFLYEDDRAWIMNANGKTVASV